SAFTGVPASSFFSTRPSVVAGIDTMSSGTSVPSPRTLRIISPRLTVSGHTVDRSTLWAAGCSRFSPIVIDGIRIASATPIAILLIILALAAPLRGTSMVNPHPSGQVSVQALYHDKPYVLLGM